MLLDSEDESRYIDFFPSHTYFNNSFSLFLPHAFLSLLSFVVFLFVING